ncbi:MAG: SpoIIE family protein phosphatase [Acidobacteria bacterium]|nr:SpoIIE family protein phosphatase [Acidobacteriota bacterium]
MKIRTQLAIACFLLAILPLGAIVFYSYHSSKRALQMAYHQEAVRATRQMNGRLARIRTELEQRLADASALPIQQDPTKVLVALGDAASLVDSVEIQPLPTAALAPVARTAPVVSVAPIAPVAPAAPAAKVAAKDADAAAGGDADADADADTGEDAEVAEATKPIVIDIPAIPNIPRFRLSDEQRAKIQELSRLGMQLGTQWQSMSAEQREELKKTMQQKQQELDQSMKFAQADFEAKIDAAEKKQEQRRAESEARREEIRARNETRREALREKQEREREQREAAKLTPKTSIQQQIVVRRAYTAAEKEKLRQDEKRVGLFFGQKFNVPMRKEGAVVAQLSAQVKPEEVIRRILGASNDEDGDVPFAVDREDNLYTRTPEDREKLDRLGLIRAFEEHRPLPKVENWVIATSFDKQSELRVGVARPVGENLEELRRTAAWNFGAGIALLFVALIGIVPIANHITRDVQLVTAGAERIAHGDLMTRLPVRSKRSEFGQLAAAFNRMAEDLSHQQQRIVEQERVAVEYERKSVELEEARRFQLSMLPKELPRVPGLEVAVFTQTATEVGGDYYDFRVGPDGVLSMAVGDATGHGAKAGTMVTVIKTLFSGYDGTQSPAVFLGDAAEKIKRMELGRMAMSLLLARFDGLRATIAAAGMPPAFVHRVATGSVEEVAQESTPLGTLGTEYHDRTIDLAQGDTVLLLTDGFPELQAPNGQQIGYSAACEEFARAARAGNAQGVIDALAAASHQWHGDLPPNDDITFVVVRMT